MASSYQPPELQPDFPVRSGPLPQGSPIGGRELYKQAVRDFFRREIRQHRGDRHRLARRSEAQWDRASDIKWKVLPSIIRRRWEAESRRLWPRRGDDPTVRTDPMDVFCNADEIYYARGRKRPGRIGQKLDWSEGQSRKGGACTALCPEAASVADQVGIVEYIRERYQPVYDALNTPPAPSIAGQVPGGVPQNAPINPNNNPANPGNNPQLPLIAPGKAIFQDEVQKIDHARGWDPPGNSWLAGLPTYRRASDNGLRSVEPNVLDEFNDKLNLHEAIGNRRSKGQWKWHKELGAGTYGRAMLYRWADGDGNTIARVVVKRDLGVSSFKERRILRNLRDAGVQSKYIVKYLGQNARGEHLGRTYLEYAPYGDLSDLYGYYMANNIMIPEAFIWYLLLCLAEAAIVLERPVPPNKKAMFHYDIKPANVLLTYPDVSDTSRHWHQNYPVVQLADMGGVHEYPNPDQPETIHRGGGTPGWSPWVSTLDLFAAFNIPANRPKSFMHNISCPSQFREQTNVKERNKGLTHHQELNRQVDQEKCNSVRNWNGDKRGRPASTPAPKPELPVNPPCRIHTSIYQIGLLAWYGMRLPPNQMSTSQLWLLPQFDPNLFRSEVDYWHLCARISRTDFPSRHLPRNRDEGTILVRDIEAVIDHFFPEDDDDDDDPPPPPTTTTTTRKRGRKAPPRPRPKPKRKKPNPHADPLLDAAILRAQGGSLHPFNLPSYPARSALAPHYSPRLVECVYRCLEPLAENRPSPRQLLAEARDACDADLARWWPGGGVVGGVVAGDGAGKASSRPVVPGPGPWVGAGRPPEEGRVGMERPRGVILREDKYPIGERVLRDFWT
ncbi:hypothetical protein SLS58_003777 [Diplodia intermedia]|uniref:Protein kinase domain-containing protein n=1 Tax=Diplodia intermedia TaxID=856260 RepID=A0ABR3TVG3_9PEZI